MKIEINKLYKNRTFRYLVPKLRRYQDMELLSYLGSLNVLAVGIGDFLVKEEHNNHLFILINSKFNPRIFASMMEYIQGNDYYTRDYAFDNVQTGSMHMIVLKLPNEERDLISTFLSGKYSELYDVNEAFDIIQNEEVIDVIFKEHSYRTKFISQVHDEFGTVLTLEEIGDRELDFPPLKHEEIFQ